MAFNIRMGLPEMEALWNDLSTRKQQGKLDRDEEKFFKKLVKSLGYLAENPRHNSLASHEIDDLTRKYGFKIFQSYLENNTPSAGRMFWAYGPDIIPGFCVLTVAFPANTQRLPPILVVFPLAEM
jgi:hypothetical protein